MHIFRWYSLSKCLVTDQNQLWRETLLVAINLLTFQLLFSATLILIRMVLIYIIFLTNLSRIYVFHWVKSLQRWFVSGNTSISWYIITILISLGLFWRLECIHFLYMESANMYNLLIQRCWSIFLPDLHLIISNLTVQVRGSCESSSSTRTRWSRFKRLSNFRFSFLTPKIESDLAPQDVQDIV